MNIFCLPPASYNKVYDPTLFVLTGQQMLVDMFGIRLFNCQIYIFFHSSRVIYYFYFQCFAGIVFSYNMSARAQIFRREQGSVVDLSSFEALMRYNQFQTDVVGDEVRLFVAFRYLYTLIAYHVHSFVVPCSGLRRWWWWAFGLQRDCRTW
jgi:hypothetical protein